MQALRPTAILTPILQALFDPLRDMALAKEFWLAGIFNIHADEMSALVRP
ncbi:MAG: hypothetical protein AAB466_04380 [Verrucomicrobiota bacterium]